MNTNKPKIEVGKSYVTKGGWKSTVVYKFKTENFLVVHQRFCDSEYETIVTPNGESTNANRIHDLVALWVDKPVIPNNIWPWWATAAVQSDSDPSMWFFCEFSPHKYDTHWEYTGHVTSFYPSEVPNWKGHWCDSLVLNPNRK